MSVHWLLVLGHRRKDRIVTSIRIRSVLVELNLRSSHCDGGCVKSSPDGLSLAEGSSTALGMGDEVLIQTGSDTKVGTKKLLLQIDVQVSVGVAVVCCTGRDGCEVSVMSSTIMVRVQCSYRL